MKKVLLFLSLVIVFGKAYSQNSVTIRTIDSLESLVNDVYRKGISRKDSGLIISPVTNKRIGMFRRSAFLDSSGKKLYLVIYLQKFDSHKYDYTHESYYYWNNKPIMVGRLISTKDDISPEISFYFHKGKAYVKKGNSLILSNDKVVSVASDFLKELIKE